MNFVSSSLCNDMNSHPALPALSRVSIALISVPVRQADGSSPRDFTSADVCDGEELQASFFRRDTHDIKLLPSCLHQ